jgi:hypothetical protein
LAALTVSTIVRTGGRRLAAALVGSSAFAVVVSVVALYIPIWLTVGLWGGETISGSAGAGLAIGGFGLALLAVPICWPLMGLYLFYLFERMESQAQLGTVGRVTLACVGSSVLAVVVFIPLTLVLGFFPLLGYVLLVLCAFWSTAALYLFRQLKSRA